MNRRFPNCTDCDDKLGCTMNCGPSLSPIVVTRGGVPCPDQAAALEEFKAACTAPAFGSRSRCATCQRSGFFNGRLWEHDVTVRHPFIPVGISNPPRAMSPRMRAAIEATIAWLGLILQPDSRPLAELSAAYEEEKKQILAVE